MMRMIRSLDLARRSKASFKTHAALVESLAQSDETLVVTQWCPARHGVATPISITGFWLIATIAVPITKPTCPLRLRHGLNFSELGAFFGRAERLRAREGASIASAATPVKTGGIRRQAVQDGCCGRGCRLLLHFSDLAPSAAQVRDTTISGHCCLSTARVSTLRGASPVAAPSMAASSCAFPRQIDPTGKSLRIFRNRVKPRN